MYAAAGIWNLVTAAAIGVDQVEVGRPLKLQKEMVRGLNEASVEPFNGAKKTTSVHVHKPLTVKMTQAAGGAAPLRFHRQERAGEFRPRFAPRSGENGYLSVANAEALYRVMRVASPSELGAVMALVGALGDDPVAPWFPATAESSGRECYYTETDNSRLVFDFLSQPQFRAVQLSALEPQAFVDLGSSKHQAELHTLGLMILLHRLRTLDLDAIPTVVRVERFDVDTFFEANSRPLTFEDVQNWDIGDLERSLRTLVMAEGPRDLLLLKNFHARDQERLSQHRVRARDAMFARVLEAVWAITSLGTPIVVSGDDGAPLVRVGWWVAPLSMVAVAEDSLARWFEERRTHLAALGHAWDPERLAAHHFAVNGFIDLRNHAVVATSKNDEASAGSVKIVQDEAALCDALGRLQPFGFFATCGLVALHYRLRCIGDYLQAAHTQIELGTYHDSAWAMPRDHREHTLVVPGVVEAFRMVSEGLEKATGTEVLAGRWGYSWRPC